ncbi:MAG: Crp/Fnr family transcriptional regulator [Alphaproteobacteria bacterium]|nr:Crp/Fnr family transcriptional regulator [Alphaproteobacteria bacterium]
MPLLDVTQDEEVPGHRSSYCGCLRSASLFSELSDLEIAPFLDTAQARTYKKGKLLYLEGESGEYFYVICSGWIKLFHTMPEGDEVIIDMLTNGHLAGEDAFFENGAHTSSAQIIEDVHLLSMPVRVLKEQIGTSQTLALRMLSTMSQHHKRHYGEMALNATQNAPQRVGSFLLRLCPIDKKTDIVFHLPYDKTLIADTLGMKGATFSRALNVLRDETGLRIKGTSVEIDSAERLIKFIYGPLAAKYTREEI